MAASPQTGKTFGAWRKTRWRNACLPLDGKPLATCGGAGRTLSLCEHAFYHSLSLTRVTTTTAALTCRCHFARASVRAALPVLAGPSLSPTTPVPLFLQRAGVRAYLLARAHLARTATCRSPLITMPAHLRPYACHYFFWLDRLPLLPSSIFLLPCLYARVGLRGVCAGGFSSLQLVGTSAWLPATTCPPLQPPPSIPTRAAS